ncbi:MULTISPECIES: hypothetical protein [Methylorubrum]|uniref:hypothetical protein n=1 Tax=Methylorubrum TaxID=2282523 RepID=UPI00209FD7C5|nr:MULTISPECIES: hypothetical protein [Methylorubrum]MCP1551639.1 hypothetical protein [Methylorubrum zatmanii]MCP1556606.1 hypothetical protein [Methylorubrum extorquens]MCP1581974.1 hypothetical protein [Methylorubrum extorquens]
MEKKITLTRLENPAVGLLGDPDSILPSRPDASAVLVPVYVVLDGTDDGTGQPRFGQSFVNLADLARLAADAKEA